MDADKFLGVGLINVFGITFFVILVILVLKISSVKSERTPEGVRNLIQTI